VVTPESVADISWIVGIVLDLETFSETSLESHLRK
jgi:hypothetical protein